MGFPRKLSRKQVLKMIGSSGPVKCQLMGSQQLSLRIFAKDIVESNLSRIGCLLCFSTVLFWVRDNLNIWGPLRTLSLADRSTWVLYGFRHGQTSKTHKQSFETLIYILRYGLLGNVGVSVDFNVDLCNLYKNISCFSICHRDFFDDDIL